MTDALTVLVVAPILGVAALWPLTPKVANASQLIREHLSVHALPPNVMGRGGPQDWRVFPRDGVLWADTCSIWFRCGSTRLVRVSRIPLWPFPAERHFCKRSLLGSGWVMNGDRGE